MVTLKSTDMSTNTHYTLPLLSFLSIFQLTNTHTHTQQTAAHCTVSILYPLQFDVDINYSV